MAAAFVVELSVGAVAGLVVGVAGVALLRRLPLTTPGLYPVASMALAAIAFGAGDALHGSGFLSVYLAGLLLGSRRARRARGDRRPSTTAWPGSRSS